MLLPIGTIYEPWGNTTVREKKNSNEASNDASLLFFRDIIIDDAEFISDICIFHYTVQRWNLYHNGLDLNFSVSETHLFFKVPTR